MRRRSGMSLVAAVLAAAVIAVSCSSAPTDADVSKAVGESDFFAGGHGNKLVEPAVPVDRGGRSADGSWPVKVKMKFTYRKSDGTESAPMESSPLFKMRKVRDAAGRDRWQAELGS